MMTESGALASRTTSLGNQLLDFVTYIEPPDVAEVISWRDRSLGSVQIEQRRTTVASTIQRAHIGASAPVPNSASMYCLEESSSTTERSRPRALRIGDPYEASTHRTAQQNDSQSVRTYRPPSTNAVTTKLSQLSRLRHNWDSLSALL